MNAFRLFFLGLALTLATACDSNKSTAADRAKTPESSGSTDMAGGGQSSGASGGSSARGTNAGIGNSGSNPSTGSQASPPTGGSGQRTQ